MPNISGFCGDAVREKLQHAMKDCSKLVRFRVINYRMNVASVSIITELITGKLGERGRRR